MTEPSSAAGVIICKCGLNRLDMNLFYRVDFQHVSGELTLHESTAGRTDQSVLPRLCSADLTALTPFPRRAVLTQLLLMAN